MAESNNRNEKGQFIKGNDAAVGNGRPKDTPEQKAEKLLAKFNDITQAKLHHLTEWIDKVAETNPSKAFDMYMQLTKKLVPDLKSVEQKIDVSDKVKSININIKRSNNEEANDGE